MPAPGAYEEFLSGVHSANWLAHRPRAARIGEDGPSEQKLLPKKLVIKEDKENEFEEGTAEDAASTSSARLAGVVVGATFSLGVAVVGVLLVLYLFAAFSALMS